MSSTEPTRLQRAWSAWLDSTGDDDGTTNAELASALAEQVTLDERIADLVLGHPDA